MSSRILLYSVTLLYSIALCFGIFDIVLAKPMNNVIMPKMLNASLVNEFYDINQNRVFWFTSPTLFSNTKNHFLLILDSAHYDGLDKNKYHYSEIKSSVFSDDSATIMKIDRIFTDAVIGYCKDMYAGADIARWINNDEVSGKYVKSDDDYLLRTITRFGYASGFKEMLSLIEPKNKEYLILRTELKNQIAAGNNLKSTQLTASVNLFRWVHHFNFDKFILVNIPSATLRYSEQDTQKLQMKVVVGKPSTRSPRFSTWCYQVILYPYWNVPKSIGLKELLPLFKKSPSSVDEMNMQVIGSNGKVIDHTRIDWSMYNKHNFPYSFRQCTGCDNSLGVIKFNLTDPFGVYLHDTNFKLAFLKNTRFLSHGCIRIEKPIELGNYLLDNKLDSNFLKACLKDQLPVPLDLSEKVPVFVVYMTADIEADSVAFKKDIYHLFGK